MMFVFVTERQVLDAVEADGANGERAVGGTSTAPSGLEGRGQRLKTEPSG